ncbi:hypothetical protein AJOOGB_AJOOGB_12150, partial [Dysosmobacter welbionis]
PPPYRSPCRPRQVSLIPGLVLSPPRGAWRGPPLPLSAFICFIGENLGPYQAHIRACARMLICI